MPAGRGRSNGSAFGGPPGRPSLDTPRASTAGSPSRPTRSESLVVLELDGKTHTFTLDVERRIGQAMLLDAGIINRPRVYEPYVLDEGLPLIEGAG